MAYQSERLFPPFIPPIVPEDEKGIAAWAGDMNIAIADYLQQVENVFNAHVTNQYAHPPAWAVWRLKRPHYKYYDNNRVVIPASIGGPVHFSVGSKLLQITADIYADLTVSGVGGLNSGVSRSANTVYYLYVVNNNGDAVTLVDTSPPSTGPTGYDDWTYVGAFITDSSANVPPFMSYNGVYRGDYAFSTTTGITSTSFVTINLSPFPDTAHMAWIRLLCSSSSKTVVAYLSGRNVAPYYVFQVKDPTGSSDQDWDDRYVPLYTPKTVYARLSGSGSLSVYCYGWWEEPTRWK